MGWTVHYNSTRSEIIADVTKGWECPPKPEVGKVGGKVECLTKCYKGSAWKGTLWVLFQTTEYREPVVIKRWIGCFLLEYYKEDNGWGYKDMEESMGPCYYNCPLSYLDMANDGIHEEWRKAVREYHAKRKLPEGFKFTPFMQIVLRLGCNPKTLTFLEKRRKTILGTVGHTTYKIRPQHIDYEATAKANGPFVEKAPTYPG